LPSKASADDSGGSGTTSEDNEVTNDDAPKTTDPAALTDDETDLDPSQFETSRYSASPFTKMASELSDIIYPESDGSIFTLDEQVSGVSTKIILSANDYAAIKALQYIGANIPDFENDLRQLWNLLPAAGRPETEDDLLKVKFENPDQFKKYLETANANWLKSDNGQKLRNIKALALVTGLSENAITEMSEADRQALYDSMMESLKLDLRVLKTLVYLVTPKDQGGAGHWRLKVRKIMQFTGKPLSTESDAVLLSNAGVAKDSSSTNCDGLTAAECGQQLPDSTTSTSGTGSTGTGTTGTGSTGSGTTAPDVTVTDKGGDQWEGYLNGVDTEEDPLKQRNISSHSTGQAVDISQVDDIRCTLIKRRRVGKDSFIPQPASPIKLAWQTGEGYAASGGNPIDTMGIIRAGLTDDVRSLVASLGGDVSSYEGDLSSANLSDVVGIVGKSLFAQILNSPSFNLSGYDASETLKNLGTMYFADYFGLPREIFINREFSSIDDVQEIIGEAAIEKRIGLPYGSLNSKNVLETAAYLDIPDLDQTLRGKTVYNLEGTFLNIAQRKLEYEMNLNTGDLDTYISQTDLSSNQDLDLLIGKRVIEKELNLKKESFTGKNMSDIEKMIGHIKFELMFKDPTYLDNLMHLDPGTSRDLLSGKTNPYEYARKVGATRKTDTLNGLKYFAANDAAYNLPTGTWEGMMIGKRSSFVTAGSFTLGRLIGDSESYSKFLKATDEDKAKIDAGTLVIEAKPDDLGVAAMQQWLLERINAGDEKACIGSGEAPVVNLTVAVTRTVYSGNGRTGTSVKGEPTSEVIPVKLGEDKALQFGLEQDDVFNMFGCAKASTKQTFERIGGKILFYGIVNKLLSEGQKAKINIMDTDPQFKTDNPQINFYLSRINTIQDSLKKVKSGLNTIKEEVKPKLEAITILIGQLEKLFEENVNLLDAKAAKTFVRDFLQIACQLKLLIEQSIREFPEVVGGLNGVIINLNVLLKAASEILAGKVIPAADSITISQIDPNILNGTASSDTGASDTNTAFNKAGNVRILFDLLARRIDVIEFFKKMGCSRAETELGLPNNSLFYLIENYEKNGIKGIDAFYVAIGQAQIEENFDMPNFYFQGDDLTNNMPDFSNDLGLLYAKAKTEIDNYKAYLSAYSVAILYADNATFLNMVKVSFPDVFKSFVKSANTQWQYEMKMKVKANDGVSITENNITNIVTNITSNKLADGIRTPEKDLLFRMGISNTTLSNLKAGTIDATTNKRLLAIDKQLGLPDGNTKALFMGQRSKLADGSSLLTADEKKQVEAGADIRINTLETYLKLINGDIKLSDLQGQGLTPDYNVTNPYAKQINDSTNSCAVTFTTDGTFVINNTYLEDDSFCINDTKGRHCFKTQDEAIRYQTEHDSDKFRNVLDSIARSLAVLLEGINPPEDLISTITSNLTNSLTNTGSVLAESAWGILEDQNEMRVSQGEAPVPIDLLKKIFIKEVSAPLIDYKKAVGKVTAARVLSNKLFQGLGFRIDSSLIDSGLFYEVLNGNFSAIFDLGANMIEQFIGEKIGTLRSIIRAANINTLKCALSQAGASMLGGLLGLNSVSIRGNIIDNIGQSMVEETLQLPKDTFSGDSVYKTAITARAINFVLSWKIPIGIGAIFNNKKIISQDDLTAILGQDTAKQLADAGDRYKLEKIRDALSGNPTISQEARTAVNNIEMALLLYIPSLFASFKSDDTRKLAEEPTGGFNDGNKDKKLYYKEAKEFNSLLVFMDSKFSLTPGHTAKLFQYDTNGKTFLTPDEYKAEAGKRKLTNFAIGALAEALGLSQDTVIKAETFIKDFNSVFTCQQNLQGKCNDKYQKYGPTYEFLSSIFKIDLDSKANFTPGTFTKIFNNLGDTYSILLGEAAKKLDQKLGIPSLDGENPAEGSFYKLYTTFNDLDAENKAADNKCLSDTAAALASLNTQKASWESIIADPGSTTDVIDKAKNNLAIVNNSISSINTDVESCRKNNRSEHNSDGSEAIVITIKLQLAGVITAAINKNLGALKVPSSDIYELLNGNLTYLQIILTVMTVNYIIDKAGKQEAVPASMRVSYEDIKNAYFADKDALNTAINYATWAALNGEEYNPNGNGYGPGDLCPVGTFLSSLVSCTDDPNTSVPKNGSSTNSGMAGTMANSYGCSANNNCPSDSNYGKTEYNNALYDQQIKNDAYTAAYQDMQDKCAIGHGEDKACKDAQAAYYKAQYDSNEADLKLNNIKDFQEQAVRNVKKAFQDALQYRLMDQMLWKLDKNIFSGFSRALMKGDAAAKRAALARYLKNGLINGEIFGIKFDGVPNLDMWLSTIRLVIDGKYDFNTFVSSGYFDELSNYIGNKSQNWFGFSLTPDMAKGLLMGVATGHWGQFGNATDKKSYNCDASGNNCKNNIPTFLGAVTNWAEGRIFNWADKHLGLPAGTTFGWYTQGKKIYESAKAYSAAIKLSNIAFLNKFSSSAVQDYDKFKEALNNLPEGIRNDILASIGKDAKSLNSLTDEQQKAIQGKIKEAKSTAIEGAIVALAIQVFLTFLHKWIGNSLSGFEASLGLVPGSTMVLIDAGVTYGITAAAHSLGFGPAASVSALWLAVAIFIVINLTGVYKIELKCNADGYYYHRENPQPSIVDVSDLGVWDGMDATMNQNMSIKAAQYKARRLIQDMLTMNENPLFADVFPSQIMTGRQEDATALEDSIQANICDKLGTEVKNGICDGTLAGVWANPQTVAWTHIGF